LLLQVIWLIKYKRRDHDDLNDPNEHPDSMNGNDPNEYNNNGDDLNDQDKKPTKI
jgi:hypothetical protein